MLYPSLAALAIILVAATCRAMQGNEQARVFLWMWAVGICALFPFADQIGQGLSVPAVMLVAATTIPYLLLLFSRRSRLLEEAQDELRRVLAESSKRTDDERRRMTRRLHDDISPRIVLAKLDLQHLAAMVASGIEGDEARAKADEVISRTLDALASVYQEIREVSRNTRIEMIDTIGLVAAVESLVQHYQGALERPEIVLHTNLKNTLRLPEELAINVYRMIQEALLNAVKHADAEQITIRIERRKDRYVVEVSDNGKGMSDECGRGVGLVDLRERAKVLGAELKISSASQRGTTISFAFADQVGSGAT